MEKDSKIYIAGHNGMVGSALVKEFLEQGFYNLVLKNRSELDLTSQNLVREFFLSEKPEYVVLAAAKVGGIAANSSHKADFLYENLCIQNNVIWESHKLGVKKLLFLGSSCIYPRNSQQPMKEEYFMTGKVEPTNEGYAVAKIAGMELCRFIREQYGKDFVSCMPTNLYGENDNFSEDSSHVIPALIKRMDLAKKNGSKEVVIWGSGNSRREFMEVGDFAKCVLWLMQNYSDKEFINIGTGKDVSVKELANKIKEVVGFEGSLVFDESKPDGMPRKLLDVTKMYTLGMHATMELSEGLKKTYTWYESKGNI